jgi:hypothetical protein
MASKIRMIPTTINTTAEKINHPERFIGGACLSVRSASSRREVYRHSSPFKVAPRDRQVADVDRCPLSNDFPVHTAGKSAESEPVGPAAAPFAG